MTRSPWIVAWQLQAIAVSQLLMLGILATLILAYLRLGVGRERLSSTESLALQLPFLARRGMLVAPRFSLSHPGVRQVARLMAPSLFALAIYQINVMLARQFASFLPVVSVQPVGTMLYARIDGWENFGAEERLRRATELGEAAAARGFRTVYFDDSEGEALGRWTADAGLETEQGRQ